MIANAMQQISSLPHWVQLWMRWLNIIFLLGLVFVGSHVEARYALLAYIISFPVGSLAFFIVRDIRITGLPHILFWTPLLIYISHMAIKDPDFRLTSTYGAWILALCLTIAIAVILDIKGIYEALTNKPVV